MGGYIDFGFYGITLFIINNIQFENKEAYLI